MTVLLLYFFGNWGQSHAHYYPRFRAQVAGLKARRFCGHQAKAEGEGEMTDDDPNEAYEVVPIEPGPHGPPKGWWTVKRNGLPVRHFPGKEKAQRYATDPAYRASLVTRKAWEKAKGK
jgi:hypothetical protein